MVTRDLIKAEVDKIQDRYLDTIYYLIKHLVANPHPIFTSSVHTQEDLAWATFIEQTYGSLADDPILREEQGNYEIREPIE